ncbi:MAG: GAF domain-containing protein [bacterium]|nr:GAF domain-containing protein [bacterium]
MRYDWLVPLLAAVANVVICGAVLWRRRRDRMAWVFAAMTLTIAAWDLGIFALYFFEDPARAEWWSRLARVGMCFAPVAGFHTAVLITGFRGRAWDTALGVGYLSAAVLSLVNLQGQLVAGVQPHVWGWYPRILPAYAGVTVVVAVYMLLTIGVMWARYLHPESARQRAQAKLFFLGALVQVPFSFTNLLPLYGVEMYPLGQLGNVFFTGALAYAIVRHRLMDVDFVVRKVLSFTLAAAVVLVPGALTVAGLSQHLHAEDPLGIGTAAALLALCAAVLVPMLQRALETRIQRAFFPDRWDYRRRLRQFATTLVHELDEQQLLRRLGDTLTEILELEHCHVFAREADGSELLLAHPVPTTPQPLDASLVAALESSYGPVLAGELEGPSPEAAAYAAAHYWEVLAPLRVNDRLIGVLALGENREKNMMSAEDLQLIATVAAGASVALENSRLSRELRRSEVVLQRASKLSSLGMLAAGIAHEIRNPLVAVKTFLDLLPQRLDDADFVSRFRELSQSELKRVTDLISDLLALGKSKTAERRPIELATTLEPVLRLMESTARKRQVEVIARLPPDLPLVLADSDQMKQIVLNLLLNAIEVSPPGSAVQFDVHLATPSTVVLEVRDQGPGIPPEHLETIFEPFFTTKESGTGLGLPLVHQMVTEHGGEIDVESHVGRGSAFRITFPLAAHLVLRDTGT